MLSGVITLQILNRVVLGLAFASVLAKTRVCTSEGLHVDVCLCDPKSIDLGINR